MLPGIDADIGTFCGTVSDEFNGETKVL